ncbi:hypothetical protein RHGRI_022525 [Rhododendron griersonianum]|uniref:Legume lectin domain-containing protein n=1 Tax=Rhododendron griersonianum TaxID=479676 RepID=A0AAV6IZT4_9ERIC|nr:hypothetical protein RHGRI_022525 [Rhododendron griersonianum]
MIAAALLCFTAVASPNLKTFTATYGPFNSSYYEIFQLENSAAVANNTLQLTTDYTANYSTLLSPPLENQSGRVMLKQRFKLWEQGYNETSDRVASFNSSFLFSVCPLGLNSTPGEGLAFVIAPDTYIPANSFANIWA